MKNKSKHIIRLNANENFYGCSTKVLKAVKKNLQTIHLYPSMPIQLEEKLAEKFCVEQKNVVVGAGSVRLIDGIIQTFVEPNEEIIIFERSFVAYEQLAKAHRRKYVLAKQSNFVCNIENIFPLITIKTKVIFLANPNNPTGTIITHAQLEKLMQYLSEKILVVIDEAYWEYVTDEEFPDSFSLQKKFPNLIILRTFSKIYGLAGLRIGYGIMNEEIANKLKQSRIPFFLNSLSENAAIAAFSDEKFTKDCAKKNSTERDYLLSKLIKSGLNVPPSQGNFLFVYFEKESEKEKVFNKILQSGILICNLIVFEQSNSLRIGIGDRMVNSYLEKLLKG